MRISVFGCGYLGAVHAACMAKLGHEVVGVDVVEEQVAALAAGKAPFHEPGLPELLEEALATGRLEFTTDARRAADAVVHFICVGTPQKRGENAADLSYVRAVGRDASCPCSSRATSSSASPRCRWAPRRRWPSGSRSSSPRPSWSGTPSSCARASRSRTRCTPTGSSTASGRARAASGPRGCWTRCTPPRSPTGTPKVETDLATAQLVKVAANSFLATKISFINAMAELCEATGADVTMLADAIGHDARIGRKFLNAGVGFGGGCLPKDIRAFMARAGELGVDQALSFLREVDSINMRRRVRMVDLAREVCGGSIVGRRVAVLGAAFKPDSDDIRDSPALSVAAQMQLQGAQVTVTDPKAIDNACKKWPELAYADTVEDAVRDAEVVLLLTEWPEYVALDPVALKEQVAVPRIIDGRNCLDPVAWRAAGWTYRALGRP